MKKVLSVILSAAFLVALLAGCGGKPAASTSASPAVSAAPASAAPASAKIKIGVSIWSDTDTLGSQCKTILDAAASALGVELQYAVQGHVSEAVENSVSQLVAAGCQGIIVCNSSSAEMDSIINTCTQNKVYVAQFFRAIDKTANPTEYSLAQSSPYYVGCVHEDEVTNGANLVKILADKGCKDIALEGWQAGDATFLLRWQGYKKGVEDWNTANPNNKITLLDPQYGGTTSDTGRATAEAIINANPNIDSLIVAGGGGDTLIGALAAIQSAGKTGKIKVVSTDFLNDLDKQLASGAMAGESGGHFCDPLFAMLMVYNFVNGKYTKPANSFNEIIYPYVNVASADDYANFAKYFVTTPPYTPDELKALGADSFDQLKQAASSLTIADVQKRHGS